MQQVLERRRVQVLGQQRPVLVLVLVLGLGLELLPLGLQRQAIRRKQGLERQSRPWGPAVPTTWTRRRAAWCWRARWRPVI